MNIEAFRMKHEEQLMLLPNVIVIGIVIGKSTG